MREKGALSLPGGCEPWFSHNCAVIVPVARCRDLMAQAICPEQIDLESSIRVLDKA